MQGARLDQWESKEGEKRSALRVVLDNFEFVDSKQDGPGAAVRASENSNPSQTEGKVNEPEATSQQTPQNDPDLDEDVPF